MKVYKYNGTNFLIHQRILHSGAVISLELTENNTYLAIGGISDEAVVYRFDGNTFEPFQSIKFGGEKFWRRASITGDAEYLIIIHSQQFLVEIYRFSHNASKFELVTLNEELSFSPEMIHTSEMSVQHDLIAISTQAALYIYTFDNQTV